MASSCAAGASYKKYDVFISFSGPDVRHGFISHLRAALGDQDIEAFVDDELERGRDISESISEKIEQSHIAIVIFSQCYAFSEWCLEELLKITECRQETGLTVIPVFYCVDPSHVLNLTWSYGAAMKQHTERTSDESLVLSWGDALRGTALLSGLVSSNFKTESELIKELIKHIHWILNQFDQHGSDSAWDGLVGIGARVDKVKSLLCGPQDVHVVGIWGEGGIGKTTIARATFDQISSQFDIGCFVGDVREKSEQFTTGAIQYEVDSKLFGVMTRKRLSRKKVILVLDDVSDLDQINSIIRYNFGSGSLIIVTSKDHDLLENLGAKVYAVDKLDYDEALELLCLKAFKRKVPEEGYVELCKRAVKYAQGLPLALEVLGSNLFKRRAPEWEDEMEKF